MKFIEKIKKKQADLQHERQPVIAFLGDSVTQGCFDLFIENDRIETHTYMEKGYHEKVKAIFGKLYPSVPITMVNAGISGDTAQNGLKRLDRDVLSYQPDMVVVCYGLNDAMSGESGLRTYIESLKQIFTKIKAVGSEVIFLTPNIRTNNLNVLFDHSKLNECAELVIKNENEGWLTEYLNQICKLCQNENVTVCDCNAIWNMLRKHNVDINNLLSNRINHPSEEMDWVFAYELVKTMFM